MAIYTNKGINLNVYDIVQKASKLDLGAVHI